MNQENSVLVLVEMDREHLIRPVTLECLPVGRRLADKLGSGLLAVILGHEVTGPAEEMTRYGVDGVVAVDHPLLETCSSELTACALEQLFQRLKPRAVIMGDTLTATDLAPRIASSMCTGLVTDCVGMLLDRPDPLFIKPVYSSNVMAAYAFSSEPYLLTLRAGTEAPPEPGVVSGGKIVSVELDLDASVVRTEIVRQVFEEEEGPGLTCAEVIVAGGRGMGGPEGFKELAILAEKLGAAVGASRPPCDLGWTNPKLQVGQTGEKVRPSLYIAVGISGATQHIAGMIGAGKIVAINRDRRANIFNIADYGVVGTYEEVLPAFTEALSAILK